jgi:hypothetical protein
MAAKREGGSPPFGEKEKKTRGLARCAKCWRKILRRRVAACVVRRARSLARRRCPRPRAARPRRLAGQQRRRRCGGRGAAKLSSGSKSAPRAVSRTQGACAARAACLCWHRGASAAGGGPPRRLQRPQLMKLRGTTPPPMLPAGAARAARNWAPSAPARRPTRCTTALTRAMRAVRHAGASGGGNPLGAKGVCRCSAARHARHAARAERANNVWRGAAEASARAAAGQAFFAGRRRRAGEQGARQLPNCVVSLLVTALPGAQHAVKGLHSARAPPRAPDASPCAGAACRRPRRRRSARGWRTWAHTGLTERLPHFTPPSPRTGLTGRRCAPVAQCCAAAAADAARRALGRAPAVS